MAKKILYAWADLFNDEDAVKYASGCYCDKCRAAADNSSAFGCIFRLLAMFPNIGCVPRGRV